MPRPYHTRRVVLPWPGPPLIAVRSVGGQHAIMLSTPGKAEATLQWYCETLAEAVDDARECAKDHGWRFIGVFDEEHFRQIASLRSNQGDAA